MNIREVRETHVVVPREYDEERTDRRWHEPYPRVGKDVIPDLSCPVQPSNGTDLPLRAPIEDAEVKVTARVVDSPICVTGVEYGVNDQIGERKEEA